MKKYRISKYDPAYRVNGVYIKDEWTDYSDIGLTFSEGTLTAELYEITEAKYLQCISALLQYLKIHKMKLCKLELQGENQLWEENQSLSADVVPSFIRDCLRNKCWGQLEHRALVIYTGWDFYLHIRLTLPFNELENIVLSYGLFLDEHI